MGATKLYVVPITPPVNHVISYGTAGITVDGKDCRWYLFIPKVKGNSGLSIIMGHRLIIFPLFIARIGNDIISPFHKTSKPLFAVDSNSGGPISLSLIRVGDYTKGSYKNYIANSVKWYLSPIFC